jgi:hypothetical protein
MSFLSEVDADEKAPPVDSASVASAKQVSELGESNVGLHSKETNEEFERSDSSMDLLPEYSYDPAAVANLHAV